MGRVPLRPARQHARRPRPLKRRGSPHLRTSLRRAPSPALFPAAPLSQPGPRPCADSHAPVRGCPQASSPDTSSRWPSPCSSFPRTCSAWRAPPDLPHAASPPSTPRPAPSSVRRLPAQPLRCTLLPAPCARRSATRAACSARSPSAPPAPSSAPWRAPPPPLIPRARRPHCFPAALTAPCLFPHPQPPHPAPRAAADRPRPVPDDSPWGGRLEGASAATTSR